MGEERVVPVDGADLCVETFGRPQDATILLIAGMSSSMDWWEEAFCERLAAGRRHVVRYDLRDTGRSTTYPVGEPGYTGADLRADVVALLDAFDVRRAHLVGLSMGGAIAQVVAVEHPDRVATLTLLATSAALPGAPTGLPPMTAELESFFEEAGTRPVPERSDDAVEMLLADQRAFAGVGFDEARVRALCRRVVERSVDLRSSGNHAVLEPGPAPQGSLADVTGPTLVVHGTADPMFPLPHGQALARAIPGATLLPLAGVGHEAPPPWTWDQVVPAILEHTSGR